MNDFDADDVAAMRKQGDFRAFLRQQIADGNARRNAKPATPAPSPPGYSPGAWPAGTQPPDPAPCSAADWQAHLADIRDHHARDNGQDPT